MLLAERDPTRLQAGQEQCVSTHCTPGQHDFLGSRWAAQQEHRVRGKAQLGQSLEELPRLRKDKTALSQ